MTAARRLPVQLVREDKALAYPDRASVMWRIGLALYVKAGGVPWKLAETDPETAYIGISYAVRPIESNRPRFVTCCSQVFDAEGAGLEFVAYDAHEVEVQRDNPFLSRAEMFRVMTRSMDLYRRRHAGRSPRRVMVHKTTEFKLEEIDGCMEAFHLCEAVDLVQVVEKVGWRGVQIEGGRNAKKASQPHSRLPWHATWHRTRKLSCGPMAAWGASVTANISRVPGVRLAPCGWFGTRAMVRGMIPLLRSLPFRRWTGITMLCMTRYP